MNILSYNENLLERLSLLLQNNFTSFNGTSKSLNSNDAKIRTNLVLLEQSSGPEDNVIPFSPFLHQRDEDCSKWIILFAKRHFDEDHQSFDLFGDIYRQMMSTCNPDGRILLLKKTKADCDSEEFQNCLNKRWGEEWSVQLDKFQKLGPSKARDGHIQLLKGWSTSTPPLCELAYFDDPNLLTTIMQFFGVHGILQIGDIKYFNAEERAIVDRRGSTSNSKASFFFKPPSLNWSNYPRIGEIQITFKFVFPKGTVTEPVFREWVHSAKCAHLWEYDYEWNNGILLRENLVKIALTRTNAEPHVLEISGRLDTDELMEEEGIDKPAANIWPYLVKVFRCVISDVHARATLPYTLNLIFIGEQFFIRPEGAPKITARSLNAFQTLGSIERLKSVMFRADQGIIYELDLTQCFPSFRPIQLEDFAAKNIPLTSNKAEQKGASIKVPAATYLTKESQQSNSDVKSSTPSMGLHASDLKNNKRRVSFGVIHAIPSIDASVEKQCNQVNSDDSDESDNKYTNNTNTNEQAEGPKNRKEVPMVIEYVDELLQQAIDEVLIAKE